MKIENLAFDKQRVAQVFAPYDAVVFDAGGVLLEWQPLGILAQVEPEVARHQELLGQIFAHPDWIELDRGVIEELELINRFSERTGMSAEKMQYLVEVTKQSLVLIPESVALFQELKSLGKKLFLLSNMPLSMIDFLEKRDSIWQQFDELVVSSRLKVVKPEPAIYQHLQAVLTAHKVDWASGRALFLDDLEKNIVAARQQGIRARQFLGVGEVLEMGI